MRIIETTYESEYGVGKCRGTTPLVYAELEPDDKDLVQELLIEKFDESTEYDDILTIEIDGYEFNERISDWIDGDVFDELIQKIESK